jgi:ubiquinone/menaquinone biosynthesis C-methylase UbiE
MFLPDNILHAVMQSTWVDAILRWRANDVLRKTRIHRHLPRQGLLLDLGCGLGHITEAVLREAPGRACVMMDLESEPSPHVARRIASSPTYAIKASGLHLPFPDATFDGAWTGFVLHHVLSEGQDTILGEVTRVLRPGATFVLLEDTPRNAQEAETTLLADRRLNFEPDEAPHHYRSPAEWRTELERHGFTIEQEIGFHRLFPPATLRAVHHSAFLCRRR